MVTVFQQKVYDLCKRIPKGKVSTYRDIANQLGIKAYRAIGRALNKNPYSLQVPCHRVVNSNGNLGGFAFGSSKKLELLKKEGVDVKEGKIVDFEKFLWKF